MRPTCEQEAADRHAYHATFRRLRDQYTAEIAAGVREYDTPAEVDRDAWREAQRVMDHMINQRRETERRRKRKTGEAA